MRYRELVVGCVALLTCLGAADPAFAKPVFTLASTATGAETPNTSADRRSAEAVLEEATDQLNAGENAEAIVGLFDRFGFDINQWALNARYVSDGRREVVYIVAIAMLRVEGKVERYPTYQESSPERAVDNVRWAIRAMDELAFVGYAAERHVAEAWGRDPALKSAALKKLTKLWLSGSLNSPFQLRLLSRLRAEVGEDPRPTIH